MNIMNFQNGNKWNIVTKKKEKEKHRNRPPEFKFLSFIE